MEADKRCGLAYSHQNLAGCCLAGVALRLCTQGCGAGSRIHGQTRTKLKSWSVWVAHAEAGLPNNQLLRSVQMPTVGSRMRWTLQALDLFATRPEM
jgi:hypothetical protein